MPKKETRRKYKDLMKDAKKKHTEYKRASARLEKHETKMKREYEKAGKPMKDAKKMDYKENPKGGKKKIALPKGIKDITELREKPGMSSAGTYKNVAKGDFAGPKGTYPINTKARARNALARAHFTGSAAKEAAIRRKVFAKYPGLKNPKEYTARGYKKP